jgi:hypothetical protein
MHWQSGNKLDELLLSRENKRTATYSGHGKICNTILLVSMQKICLNHNLTLGKRMFKLAH